MAERLKKHIYLILLCVISLILFIANFKPGTYLVGWDNVYPELNFSAAFKMNLASVWQTYRGLGVEDGMAHSANLLHTTLLFLLSFILPQNALRYVFHIGMHLTGGLGMYFLLKNRFKKTPILSFIGALFYEFNFITIQMFYAPFEAFSVHFAALPWLTSEILHVLHNFSFKSLVRLFIVSLLFTPQGLIPTLFIAYLALVASIMISHLIAHHSDIRKVIIIGMVIFCANAFWLLPFIHGALNQGNVIKNTKINQYSSEVIYGRNLLRGTLADVLFMRSFMVDTNENDLSGRLVYIMQEWNTHNYQPFIVGISTVFIITFLIGIVITIDRNRKHKKLLPESYFLIILGLSFIMLGTRIPILSILNGFIRDSVPLFGEAFRFPFTKFSLVYTFTFTIFFVAGLEIFIKKYGNKVIPVVLIALVLYTMPAFKGNFFYSALRLTIPPEYFQTIEYFKTQEKDARIMTLPQTTFWNWPYYTWGARGSGFLWYGIEQPMLERPFDPWSNYNEQYFNELFYALQTENKDLFAKVIDKYDISFILIDESIVHQAKNQRREKLEHFIEQNLSFDEKKVLGSLTVYKLPRQSYIDLKINALKITSPFKVEHKDSIFSENGTYYEDNKQAQIGYLFPSLFTNKTQHDQEIEISLQENKVHITSKAALKLTGNNTLLRIPSFNSETYVPAEIEVTAKELRVNPTRIELIIGTQTISLLPFDPILFPLPKQKIDYITVNDSSLNLTTSNHVVLNTGNSNNITFHFLDGKKQTLSFLPNISPIDTNIPVHDINGTTVAISLPFIDIPVQSPRNLLESNTYEINSPCTEELATGISLYEVQNNTITLTNQQTAGCAHQYLKDVPQQSGSLLYLNTENISGFPLSVLIDNPQQKSTVIETKLDGKNTDKFIIIPPSSPYSYTDYGLHFRNTSVNHEITKNKINEIRVGYIPYNFLKSLKMQVDEPRQQSGSETLTYTRMSPSLYVVSGIKSSGIVTLSQSYQEGWKAYYIQIKNKKSKIKNFFLNSFPFIFGKEIKEHVKVNNWANGWNLQKTSEVNIIIIYWPQYLEYLGFLLFPIAFGIAYILTSNKKY